MTAGDIAQGVGDIVVLFHYPCHSLVDILEFNNQEQVICFKQLDHRPGKQFCREIVEAVYFVRMPGNFLRFFKGGKVIYGM